MSFVLKIFTLLVAGALLLDTFIYPHVFKNYFLVDSPLLLIIYLVVALVFCTKIKFLPQKIIRVNQRYVFPILVVALLVLFAVETRNYPNYVYGLLHLDLTFFAYLTVLSGALAYIFNGGYAQKGWVFYILPPLSLVLVYCLVSVSPDLFIKLVQEDGVLEYGQFVLYVLSAVYAFGIFRHFRRKPEKLFSTVFFLLAIGLVFVAFEEISWGQRLFGVETPEVIKEVNHQNELTVHNLEIFQHSYLHLSYMAVGLYGALARFVFTRIPGVSKKYLIFAPYTVLFFCFFSTFSFYFLFDYVLLPNEITVGAVPLASWQEVFESYLALGFLGYTRINYKKLVS